MPQGFSILIPALNEEKNIEAAIDSVINALAVVSDDYEIIVINDGSTDRTGDIIEARALANNKIKVIHNERNQGVGYSLLRGFSTASKLYLSCFPGDNDMAGDSLADLLRAAGKSDMVISYMADMKNRSILRRMISRSFVALLNLLFGLHLKYYNGPFVFKTSTIQSLKIKSTGLAIISECLVKMLKNGSSYTEVPFVHTGRKEGKSTALSPRSFVSVFQTLVILVVDVYFRRPSRKDIHA